MSRTTVDIDPPILSDLKRLQKAEGKPLGRLVSELLAEAIGRRLAGGRKKATFAWRTANMGTPRVDLEDKEALGRVLDDPWLKKKGLR